MEIFLRLIARSIAQEEIFGKLTVADFKDEEEAVTLMLNTAWRAMFGPVTPVRPYTKLGRSLILGIYARSKRNSTFPWDGDELAPDGHHNANTWRVWSEQI